MKLILLFNLLFGLTAQSVVEKSEEKVRAWIEIEGKIQNLFVRAKLQNSSSELLTLSYILTTIKKGRTGNSKTLQKGTCIAKNSKTISLSESRMNLTKKDNLTVSLVIYHDNKLIAQDSVVLHGDNY